MKQIQSKAYNVTEDIVGKVTFNKHLLCHRSDYILVGKEYECAKRGFAATITTKEDIKELGKAICIVENIVEFNEGDIISIDEFGEIKFLYEIQSVHNAVFVTEKCNHRCIMCPQPPVLEEKDKTDFNLKLISLFDKKTANIGITGGEPTMIGDKLFKIIHQIKKYCPKASIGILSNGVRFANFEYALKLAKCNTSDLQVDVPLFSDIAEEHNRIVGAKTFYKSIKGLYNLAQLGVNVAIRVVVHKQTYKRLPRLADYIYHNMPFVSQVAFMQMETTGLAEQNINDLWIDPYDYNKELEEAISYLSARSIPAYIYNAQLCVLPQSLHSVAMQSITDWKDGFLDECDNCILKENCAGVFKTNGQHLSKHIQSVTEHSIRE